MTGSRAFEAVVTLEKQAFQQSAAHGTIGGFVERRQVEVMGTFDVLAEMSVVIGLLESLHPFPFLLNSPRKESVAIGLFRVNQKKCMSPPRRIPSHDAPPGRPHKLRRCGVSVVA